MTVLFICKLYSSKGNGVISAMNTEIKYLQKKCKVALYNLGVNIVSNDIDMIFDKKSYEDIVDLPKPFNKPDLVVFEEIYKFDYISIYKQLLKKQIPYIIIPHGSLVTLEQKRKFFKKKIANILFFNSFIKNAGVVEFLNEQEKNNSNFHYKDSIIIPNGVEPFNNVKNKEFDNQQFKFVFIGRYSIYTKGLDLMINSFLSLKDWCLKNNVKLEMYGPLDNYNEIKMLENMIDKNDLNQIISVNGPIYDDKKSKILQEASVFIQTSRHEGQPMGIIEALSYALPCIVTYETSFGEFCNNNKCGIGVNFDAEQLKKAIVTIYNSEIYNEYSKNALKCFNKNFDIKNITKYRLSEYSKIIRGEKNDF